LHQSKHLFDLVREQAGESSSGNYGHDKRPTNVTSYKRLFYQGSKTDGESDGNSSEGDAAGTATPSEQNNHL